MKHKYVICLLMALIARGAFSQTVVNTKTALQNAVNNASGGEVFVVPDGTYSNFTCSFTKAATADAPITIKAATVGGVTLTGNSYFNFKKASHIILEGFVFDCTANSTLIKLEASNNIRITRNVFEQDATSSVKWIVVVGTYNDYTFEFLSHHNRIDHNIFKNKLTPGNFITIDGTYNQTQTKNYQSTYDRIDHNYFYNSSPRVENEKEAIRIGNSQLCNSSGYTTVEFNLFEDCDGDPEIVSVKSNDNFILNNTFRGNYGTLCLRQGNRTRVEGNYFLGNNKPDAFFDTQPIYTGGIRVYGTDHVIVNNYMEGLRGTKWDAPITLTQGDVITGQSTNYSAHFRPERITIGYNTLVNNVYGIEVGYSKADNSYNKKLKDIYIANNLVTGSQNSMVHFFNDQAGEVEWFNNLLYPIGTAQVITGNPALSAAQAQNVDPNLAFDGTLWRATATTPVMANGYAPLVVAKDIDGNTRPASSNPGADAYVAGAATYLPLLPPDVGPYADDTVLAVSGTEALGNLKLYPNPGTGRFTLELGKTGIATVEVMNVHGQVVLSAANQSSPAMIDLTDKAAGLYFIKVTADERTEVLKVLKQ
ncbi:MAG: chondroitinase-B domain-containing protein [Flavobacterium sp.]